MELDKEEFRKVPRLIKALLLIQRGMIILNTSEAFEILYYRTWS